MNRKRASIFQDIYYRPYRDKFFKYATNAKDDEEYLRRLGLLKKIPIHKGCVNTICWNDTGQYILSGSDDQHLVITNGHDYKIKVNFASSHTSDILSAKFMPQANDREIVSCARDGIILHTDITNQEETVGHMFTCHRGTTHDVITSPFHPHIFFSCGEDGTVRCFDLRIKSSCSKSSCKDDVIIDRKRSVTTIAINPVNSHLIAVSSVNSVYLYDRRFLKSISDEIVTGEPLCSFGADFGDIDYRIASLCYSDDGYDMLVSYNFDYVYLFNILLGDSPKNIEKQFVYGGGTQECINWYEAELKMKYIGHNSSRSLRTDVIFWGNNYVMSGSDDGYVFVWNRFTGKLAMILQGDEHVVTCLQSHPTLSLLASSGIDYDIKLWAPILEETNFDSKVAQEITSRNKIMLE